MGSFKGAIQTLHRIDPATATPEAVEDAVAARKRWVLADAGISRAGSARIRRHGSRKAPLI